ncbi:MAG: hypothetical protein Q7S76_01545 [bacterium]|nr:hypothetical protein [bacterium]
MMKEFFSNFFRSDLNLKERWWHRLLVVLFFGLLLWALYMMYGDLSAPNHPYIPQWKVVETLDARLTIEVHQIRDLKKAGEKVEERDRSYALNSGDDSLYDDFYCSIDLESKVSDIQTKSGISNLYLKRETTTLGTFTNYVRENDIKCLIPDAYTYSDNTRVTFLEPLGPNPLYGKDLVFYEKSGFLTVFYILQMLALIIAIFAGIAVMYYKLFLYIIFGSAKKPIQYGQE